MDENDNTFLKNGFSFFFRILLTFLVIRMVFMVNSQEKLEIKNNCLLIVLIEYQCVNTSTDKLCQNDRFPVNMNVPILMKEIIRNFVSKVRRVDSTDRDI